MYATAPPKRLVISSRGGPRSQQEAGVKGPGVTWERRPNSPGEQRSSTRGKEKERTPTISVGRCLRRYTHPLAHLASFPTRGKVPTPLVGGFAHTCLQQSKQHRWMTEECTRQGNIWSWSWSLRMRSGCGSCSAEEQTHRHQLTWRNMEWCADVTERCWETTCVFTPTFTEKYWSTT